MSPRRLAEKSFTYTAANTPADLVSTLVNSSQGPMTSFSLQAKATGWTTWTLLLEGSLDNANWDTLLTHTNVTPADGKIIWTTVAKPVKYTRMSLTAVSGGTTGQTLVATMLGVRNL